MNRIIVAIYLLINAFVPVIEPKLYYYDGNPRERERTKSQFKRNAMNATGIRPTVIKHSMLTPYPMPTEESGNGVSVPYVVASYNFETTEFM